MKTSIFKPDRWAFTSAEQRDNRTVNTFACLLNERSADREILYVPIHRPSMAMKPIANRHTFILRGTRECVLVATPWASNCVNTKLHGITRVLRCWHKWTRPWPVGSTGVWFAILLVERHHARTRYTPTVFTHNLCRRWHHQWNRPPDVWVVPATMPNLVSSP